MRRHPLGSEADRLLRPHQQTETEYPFLTGQQYADRLHGRGRQRCYSEVPLWESDAEPPPEPEPEPCSRELLAQLPAALAAVDQAGLTLPERVAWMLLTVEMLEPAVCGRILGCSERQVRRLRDQAGAKIRAHS